MTAPTDAELNAWVERDIFGFKLTPWFDKHDMQNWSVHDPAAREPGWVEGQRLPRNFLHDAHAHEQLVDKLVEDGWDISIHVWAGIRVAVVSSAEVARSKPTLVCSEAEADHRYRALVLAALEAHGVEVGE